MHSAETFLDMLIQSLRLVASDAEMQMGVLPKYVHVPDEVVSIFDDSYILLDQVIEAGLVTPDQAEAVHELNRHMDEMSLANDPDLWTLEAIKTHPKWVQMRALASNALVQLKADTGRPTLGWITYVPGGK
jgi:hypothetical protein